MILSPPLSSINFFAKGKHLQQSTEESFYEIFRHCETIKIRHIIVTKPSEAWKFSIPENSDTLKGCPTKFFGTVRQKKWPKMVTLPPPFPLFSINFFDTRNFVKQKRPLTKFFRLVRQNIFGKTMMPPLLCIKIFDTRSLLKHRRGLLRSFSVLWD